jgi:hypothetical protein
VKEVGKDTYFLFINAHETHAPYGYGFIWEDSAKLISYGKEIWGCKVSQQDYLSIRL